MGYYSRPIEMPTTKRDGLANFVQIIINQLEAGNAAEALLQAVNLRQDIDSGSYDNAMADALGHSAVVDELKARHAEELVKAGAAGLATGLEAGARRERSRMATLLGLEEAA